MAQIQEIVVAASIDNELTSKDFADIKRLKDAGHHIHLSYYLPKVPAQYTQLPEIPPRIERWHSHGHKILQELGNKLQVPKEDQHFTDEILGPDEVFDDARFGHAAVIITSRPKELHETFLSKVFNRMRGLKDIPVKSIHQFVKQVLPDVKGHTKPKLESANEPVYGSVFDSKQQKSRKRS